MKILDAEQCEAVAGGTVISWLIGALTREAGELFRRATEPR